MDINFGIISKEDERKINCECNKIFEKVRSINPQLTYQIKRNDNNEVLLNCKNGFEAYLALYSDIYKKYL